MSKNCCVALAYAQSLSELCLLPVPPNYSLGTGWPSVFRGLMVQRRASESRIEGLDWEVLECC